MLDAVVRQSGDLPCFSVSSEDFKTDEEVEVAGIQVSEIDKFDQVLAAPWTAGFANNPTPVLLSPETCIQYGAPNVEHRGAAAALTPGRHYTVFINAHVQRRKEWHNRSYRGYFCLARDADGDIEVRQVIWNDESSYRRWDVCASDPIGLLPDGS